MEVISSKFIKLISSTLHQGKHVSLRHITKENLPYFWGIVFLLLWLDLYIFPIGFFDEDYFLFKLSPLSFFPYLYSLTAIATICLFNVRKLLPYTKFSALFVAIGFIADSLFIGMPISYIGLALVSVSIGHIIASTSYGFFMILNNSEKIYSISIAIFVSKAVLLLKAYFSFNNETPIIFRIMGAVCCILILISTCFYQKSDSYETYESIDKTNFKDYSILGLAFVVFLLNDFLAPTLWGSLKLIPIFTLNTYYVVGVFFGIIITIFLQQSLNCNICYVLNFSFAIITLGFVTNLIAYNSGEWIPIPILLFGISYGIGFISIYYMLGIISKKSHSLTFYRVVMLSITMTYIIGFSLLNIIKAIKFKDLFIFANLFSVIILLIIFLLTPFFTKVLYHSEWTDDLHRPDVTYVSRLTSHLSELNLSPREVQVCQLLLEGYTLRQISAMLNIAYSTVNTYCTSIYRKLEVNSRAELILMFKEYTL